MKALLAGAEAALIATMLSSCSHIVIDSVRPTFVDPSPVAVPGTPPAPPKLDVKCLTLATSDEAEVTSKLKALYDQSWRMSASGSRGGDLFLCFERPAGIVDPIVATPRRKKAAAKPPPPPADDAPASSDETPAPRPARHRPALDGDAAPSDDSAAPAAAAPASDDSSADAPAPKSKRRRAAPPPTDDSGDSGN